MGAEGKIILPQIDFFVIYRIGNSEKTKVNTDTKMAVGGAPLLKKYECVKRIHNGEGKHQWI